MVKNIFDKMDEADSPLELYETVLQYAEETKHKVFFDAAKEKINEINSNIKRKELSDFFDSDMSDENPDIVNNILKGNFRIASERYFVEKEFDKGVEVLLKGEDGEKIKAIKFLIEGGMDYKKGFITMGEINFFSNEDILEKFNSFKEISSNEWI